MSAEKEINSENLVTGRNDLVGKPLIKAFKKKTDLM